ncbi:TPA: hypothetical protein ACYZXV_002990 [Escherichia coli]
MLRNWARRLDYKIMR